MKIIFKNGIEADITSIRRDGNFVTVVGNIPKNTTGFIIKDDNKILDYSDFISIYRVNKNGIAFTNTGAVYVETNTIHVYWNDSADYDHLRPAKVDVSVYKNGVWFEDIELNDSNNWSKTYTDVMEIPIYSVTSNDVEEYTKKVTKLDIMYYHKADIPEPEPSDLDARVEALENDVQAIDDAIGGVVTYEES